MLTMNRGLQHTNNKTTPSRAKIITNQLIRMSSTPKIMSSFTFTQQRLFEKPRFVSCQSGSLRQHLATRNQLRRLCGCFNEVPQSHHCI